MQMLDVKHESSADGILMNIDPNQLQDLAGGNIRRKRKKFNELVESIKENGILQPVLARRLTNGELELIAGFGRRDAAIRLGLKTIPLLLRDVDDETALLMHLKENSDREEITLLAEVDLAKRFTSFYHGDRKSAAIRLGWSITRLSERLELVHAAPEVLEALDDGQISAGHALILSGFENNIQINTLAKVIDENWTVAELRQRASRFQMPLSLAKFDQSDCRSCPHNTQRQSGLFGFGEQAECSKPSCFSEKTKVYLDDVKKNAQERFGAVLWLSESLPQDRNTVTPEIVGEAQFKQGCQGCEQRVCVIDDTPSKNTGDVIESQCIDKQCFTTCVDNLNSANAQAENENENENEKANSAPEGSETSERQSKSVKTVKQQVVAPKVSQPAIDAHKAELRNWSAAHLQNNKHYTLALQVIGMAQFAKYPIKGNSNRTIAKLMTLSEDQLLAFIDKIAQYSLLKTSSFGGELASASSFLAAATVATQNGADELVKNWKPTTEVLSRYVTSGIEQLCSLSGFDRYYENKHGEKAFSKVSSGKKADFIKAIVDEHDFDWSHFAPASYTELVEHAKQAQPQAD